jgi:hypothetical protein
MDLTPTQESFLATWLKKQKQPVNLPRRKAPTVHQRDQNPKWNDDTWFEERHGDPDYYTRVKGLN